jgi:hypothetical protein
LQELSPHKVPQSSGQLTVDSEPLQALSPQKVPQSCQQLAVFSEPLHTESPQETGQSLSLDALQPFGQQPSAWAQALMGLLAHVALQVDGSPLMMSCVQPLPSSQVVGHVEGGSQVSPWSITPLPQAAEQSSSFALLQFTGQHPSPSTQATTGSWVQTTSQVEGSPVMTSVVQALTSSQEVGQEAGGSQVSP